LGWDGGVPCWVAIRPEPTMLCFSGFLLHFLAENPDELELRRGRGSEMLYLFFYFPCL